MGIHRGIYQRQHVDGGIVDNRCSLALYPAKPLELESFMDQNDQRKIVAFKSTFQFNDASYQDGLRLGLVDYQVFGGSAGFLYHLTERTMCNYLGTYTNFHTTNAPFKFGLASLLPGAMLSVTHSFTESLKANGLWWTTVCQFHHSRFNGLSQKHATRFGSMGPV
jgi:hypothetical protein